MSISFHVCVQGLGQAPCERCLKGDVPAIVEFVSSIGLDEEFDEDIIKVAVDLLGDLCSVIQVGLDYEGLCKQFCAVCMHAALLMVIQLLLSAASSRWVCSL